MQDSRARSSYPTGVPKSSATATLNAPPRAAHQYVEMSGVQETPRPALMDPVEGQAINKRSDENGSNTLVSPSSRGHVKDVLTSTPAPTSSEQALPQPRTDDDALPPSENRISDESIMDMDLGTSKLETTTSSSNSLLDDLTTNGELDSVKISSWKLPKVKKFHDRTLFSANRPSNKKDSAPYNIKEHKQKPSKSEDPKRPSPD